MGAGVVDVMGASVVSAGVGVGVVRGMLSV